MSEFQELFLGLTVSTWLSIALFVAVVYIVAQWKMYEKAGQPGWAVLIPFYNVYILLKIVGKPGWWLLLIIFVPLLNVILAIWMTNLLSKSFGKDVLFTLGLIFLGIIFYPILGFGDARYLGPAGKQNG